MYSSNFEEAQRQLVEEIISTYRDTKKNSSPEIKEVLTYYANVPSKEKKRILAKADEESKKLILNYQKFFVFDERKGIEEYFDDIYKDRYEIQRDEYVESIIHKMLALDQMGAFDKYLSQYNEQMRKNKIPEMQMTKEEVVDCYGELDESVLRQYNLVQLASMNAFWVNRLSKEIDGFNTAFFATKTLNLWDRIRNAPLQRSVEIGEHTETVTVPKEEFDYDSEDCSLDIPLSQKLLEALAEKIVFLKSRYRYIMGMAKKDIDSRTEVKKEKIKSLIDDREEYISTIREVNADDIFVSEAKDIQADYEAYFSRINGGVLKDASNDYMDDMSTFSNGENIREELYVLKDYMLNVQLFSLFNDQRQLKNWGVYLDKNETLKDKRMMIIAMDIQGLNMPIRLHVPISKVQEFMKSNGYGDYFPIYQGSTDFQRGSLHHDNIGTPLLLPTTTQYSDKVKEALDNAEGGSKKFFFLKHLESLIDGNIPEHLKDVEIETKKISIQSKKGKRPRREMVTKEKRRFKERFYNFKDGKIYVKNPYPSKDGSNDFIEDKDYWSR